MHTSVSFPAFGYRKYLSRNNSLTGRIGSGERARMEGFLARENQQLLESVRERFPEVQSAGYYVPELGGPSDAYLDITVPAFLPEGTRESLETYLNSKCNEFCARFNDAVFRGENGRAVQVWEPHYTSLLASKLQPDMSAVDHSRGGMPGFTKAVTVPYEEGPIRNVKAWYGLSTTVLYQYELQENAFPHIKSTREDSLAVQGLLLKDGIPFPEGCQAAFLTSAPGSPYLSTSDAPTGFQYVTVATDGPYDSGKLGDRLLSALSVLEQELETVQLSESDLDFAGPVQSLDM